MPSVFIHHFDDEPDQVDWLLDAIVIDLIKNQSLWLENLGQVEIDEPDDDLKPIRHRVQFDINNSSYRIEYWIYPTTESFRDNAKPSGESDLVILDVMDGEAVGSKERAGIELYEHIKDMSWECPCIFLTAYFRSLEEFGIDPSLVISKPPTVSDLVSRVLRLVEIN